MFSCPIAKVVWGVMAMCFGQQSRPSNYEEFWPWIARALPGGDEIYMFGLAACCWAIWKARNRACFEKKCIKNHIDIIFVACSFIRYWAGLHSTDAQKAIDEGIELMLKTTFRLLGKQGKTSPGQLLLCGTSDDAPDGGRSDDRSSDQH
jgi:hypothetical protein